MALPFKDILSSVFGGKNPIDSVKDLIGEFHMSPEDKQKMTDALEAKAQHWRDFEAKIVELDNANTASAREMNAKIQGDKPSWLAKNIGYLIDIVLVGMWLAITFYIIARALKIIDIDGKQVDFTVVLGIYSGVTAMAATVVNFHRGSSQGSVDKAKMIEKLTQ
jgi:hypothetical protein